MSLEPAQCLFVAVLLSGLASQPLPGGGLWTGFGAFVLAGLWLPNLALASLAFMTLAGIAISALRAPRPAGLAMEGLALSGALAAGRGWPGAFVYLLASLLLGLALGRGLKLEASRLWRALLVENLWSGCANLVLALVLSRAYSPEMVAALIGLQLLNARGKRNFAYRLQSGAARATLGELANTEQNLADSERAAHTLRYQVQLLNWLSEALKELAGRLRTEDILPMLQSITQQLFQQEATIIYWEGQQRPWGQPSAELSRQLNWVLRDQQPLRTQNILGVPLTLGRDVRGAIVLQRSQPAWQESDLQSLLALSRGAGVSLSNASLFAQLEAQHQQLLETQAQLVQSGKLRAVGQMAAGIAHELNSPLGAVYMNLEMLCKNAPENLKGRLDRALQATQRARAIIEKLLDHSRPAAPDQPLDLAAVVREGIDFVAPQCAGVSLTCQPLEPLRVCGRAGELQQILTNLILNARDACLASPQPTVVIGCGLEGGRAVLWVSDNGPGVPGEVAGRLFDPFFTTKEPGRGTGLGLWTSQEIARSHNGFLDFESQPGRGTRFCLRLPVAP
ncbi:MAG: hypothetical protein KF760_26255 [Candidatus Eremiobacteraeota bacterium]|nr:hypothetical protein [Candidatus Eremiobacteraeota bacterium]MCW5869548.1 hypothetical protein [Candidatus Eremiobacteraeota bacterium]